MGQHATSLGDSDEGGGESRCLSTTLGGELTCIHGGETCLHCAVAHDACIIDGFGT